MSTYLDQLIKTVEAEAAEEQTQVKQQERTRRFPSKRAGSALKRVLQRLDVLRSLRTGEQLRSDLPVGQR